MFSARDLESTNPANRSLKPFTALDFKGVARICHSICHGLQAVNSPVTNSLFLLPTNTIDMNLLLNIFFGPKF